MDATTMPLSEQANSDQLGPSQYFNAVKAKRISVSDGDLDRYFANCLILLDKFLKTRQISAAKRLLFHIDCIGKERELVKAGITSFVYKDDITDYIEKVAGKTVKIIDLESFQREIPDDVVNIILHVGDLFDQLYVVFTDYTGREERRVSKERRDKDPILFGTFQSPNEHIVVDRFYYLADWVDEMCDLTLDKLVSEMNKTHREPILHPLSTPTDLAEIKMQLNALVPDRNGHFIVHEQLKKPSFLSRVRTFLKRS